MFPFNDNIRHFHKGLLQIKLLNITRAFLQLLLLKNENKSIFTTKIGCFFKAQYIKKWFEFYCQDGCIL